jgi:uncharacterized damage-inducible protein DinB
LDIISLIKANICIDRFTTTTERGITIRMNANAFRHFYDYHFSENRKIWDQYVMPLSQEAFVRDSSYSRGSVRNQIMHMMDVDDAWFSELRGVKIPYAPNPEDMDDRDEIRQNWDGVEKRMREYLAALEDQMLFEKPIKEKEDKDLAVWQVLLHVVNHGTDHRAQVLRLLRDLGVVTGAQDYVFYAYKHP